MGLQITDNHYDEIISSFLQNIRRIGVEGEEQHAWEVACKWARAKYRNISNDIFTQVSQQLTQVGFNISLHNTTTPLSPPHLQITTTPDQIQVQPLMETDPITEIQSTTPSEISTIAPDQKVTSPVFPITPKPSRSGSTPEPSILSLPQHSEPGRSRPLSVGEFNLPPTPPKSLSTRHKHRGNKAQNWRLTPTREILILGASNIARLPPIRHHLVQVDSYPGANLAQATHLIKYNTPTTAQTTKVLLCFGLNNRSQSNTTILQNNLDHLIAAAKDTFPNATIFIPIINFSPELQPEIIHNILRINQLISQTDYYIHKLEDRSFHTDQHLIHWTPNTAALMWQHWWKILDPERKS